MKQGGKTIRIAAVAILTLALAWTGAARGSTPEAAGEIDVNAQEMSADKAADKSADKKADKSADKKAGKGEDNGTENEHPLSPVLEQAIRVKEKEVTEARHEGIRLLEDYLHDSARGPPS